MRATSICEIVLEVRDLGAAESFYEGVLQLPVTRISPTLTLVEGETFRIHLQGLGEHAHRGGSGFHFCFTSSEEEIGEASRAAQSLGLTIVGPKHLVNGVAAVWMFDYDNNEVELSNYYLLDPRPRMESIDPSNNQGVM